MENRVPTPDTLDSLLAEYARRSAERRLCGALRADYRRLHRGALRRRAVAYAVALAAVGLAASAAIPPAQYDYITANHVASPAATIAGVHTTLAAL